MGAIDLSFLTSWYDAKAGIIDGGSSTIDTSNAGIAAELLGSSATVVPSSAYTPAKPATPTPPWSVSTSTGSSASSGSSAKAGADSLVNSLLAGGKLINPSAAKLDVSGGSTSASENYQNLFALYQGLTGLQTIAQQALSSTTGLQTQQLQQAFQSGMQQIQSYLSGDPFSGFNVYQTAPAASETSTVAVAQETDAYTTQSLDSGAMNGVVPAFQGNVQFSLTATKLSGVQTAVSFDFSEMGAQSRTFANVLSYMNGKMAAAGLATRFADSYTPATASTTTGSGATAVTTPGTPAQYALKIQGTSVESLAFSAPATDPAVYVAQSSGITSTDTSGGTPDAVQQLVKFDASAAPADASATNGQISKQTFGSSVSRVQATATAPDGSVYVLADVAGDVNGQSINGSSDVALIKYDSAGNVVFTRTLGAPSGASGFGLAVSGDGSQVAVTGSTTDNLDPTASSSSASSAGAGGQAPQGFVTVYDSQGDENWTQQTAAIGGNGAGVQPNAVAFGANGMVYVAGQVDGTIPGGSSSGGEDAYVQAFHAASVPLNDGSGASEWVVAQTSVQQFGTTGQDHATGVAVGGSSVYVSSMENGHAVVRAFAQSGASSTGLTLTASRDLGAVQGGNVAGVAVNADGSVIVAGSTHNGALDGGTVTQAYGGGEAAFVASLSPDLRSSSSDRIAYLGSSTDQTASAVTVSGGQVYIAGQIATTTIAGMQETSAHNGYVAAVDTQTGQVTWSQTYSGQDHEAAPTGIAVGQGGASVLDQLGLPTAVNYGVSQQLVASSSLRPGDGFYIQSGYGGAPQEVTVSSADTYQTLAQKIERASNYTVTATVLTGTSGQTLKLAPAYSSQKVGLLPGASGFDALSALGLQQGVLTSTAGQESSAAPSSRSGSLPASNSLKNGYSLKLPSNLNLNSAADINVVISALGAAASTVQGIYTDMTTAPTPSSSSSGSVPAYLTNEIADYQAALQRLTSGG